MIDGIKCLGEVQEDTHHMLAVFQSPSYFINHVFIVRNYALVIFIIVFNKYF